MESIYYPTQFMIQYCVYSAYNQMLSVPVPFTLSKVYLKQHADLCKKGAQPDEL